MTRAQRMAAKIVEQYLDGMRTEHLEDLIKKAGSCSMCDNFIPETSYIDKNGMSKKTSCKALIDIMSSDKYDNGCGQGISRWLNEEENKDEETY